MHISSLVGLAILLTIFPCHCCIRRNEEPLPSAKKQRDVVILVEVGGSSPCLEAEVILPEAS